NGTFNFGIAKAEDVSTDGSVTVSGTFPVTGSTFTVIDGANSLGAVDVDAVTISAAARNVDLGSKEYQVGKFRFYETASKEDIKITSLRLYNNGNTTDADLANLKLKNDSTGEVLATAAATTNKYVTFKLDPALTITKGQNKTVVVTADVSGGATRTAQFIIQNDYDISSGGSSTSAGILATHATNLTGDATAGFPVGDAANYNTITISQGSLTVTKDNSSPSGNVSQGQSSVVLGYWKLEAVGEDIELQKADIAITGTTAAADFTGTISLMVDNTTIYSTSTLAPLLDDDAAGADQVTLSNYYIIPSGKSVLAKLVANMASGATDARTLIGNLSDVYYRRASSNNYATASAGTFITGNTLTISTAALTVAVNSAFGSQNIVAGGANTKVGSYLLQAGSAEGVNVSSINVDISSATGATNMRLKKVNQDSSETQIGSTVSTPSTTDDANSFAVGGQLNIPASGTVVVNVYVDFSSSATGTYTTDIDAADVTASGSASGAALSGNVPVSAVTGPTITAQATGTLLVETDTSTPIEAVVHASETDRELLKLRFTTQYEAVKVTKLVMGIRKGNANVSSLSLTAGPTTVSTVPINGQATFSGLTLQVLKDSTLQVAVKGNLTASGTLISADVVRVGIDSLEATGVSSGSRVYERARTTTATGGDIAPDAATQITVVSTEGIAVGDVVYLGTAQALSSFTGVVTAIGGATTMSVLGPQDVTAACAAGANLCYVTKLSTREYVTGATGGSNPATLTDKTAVAIDVSSTRGFTPGDVVRLQGVAGTVDDGGFYTVTNVADGNTMTVIGVGEVTADPNFTAADHVTRMATTASTQVRVISSITANAASAVEVNSTVGFVAGDVVVLNSTSSTAGTRQLYTVAAVTDADTLSLIGKGAQVNIPVNSWVTKLATTRTTTTTTATDDIAADTASVVNVTSGAGFVQGDVVMLNSTKGGDLYMVTAAAAGTVTLLGETAQTDIPAGSYVTILASSTANGGSFTVHDVEPVITLNSASPGLTSTVSGSTSQLVALFDVVASGDVPLSVSAMTLTRGGNIGTRVAVGSAPRVYDYTSGSQGSLLGTGANWDNTTSGSTSAITLTSPYTISAGQKATFGVTVDTSSAAANDTFQVYVNYTTNLAGLFGGLSWYYTAVAPSPGTEPTSASPSTLSDSYPVYGYTLRY
ncbi:MAG: hypothetical protein HY536_01910, partial [Candidatus Colwellbacteria bacterium]|nr:hypothetical protein [Candidatus Colwellbacteria bacterium]